MRSVGVGCAGWSLSSGQRTLFDDGENMLARYASRFSVVEINSSFYRPHQQATYARWAAAVPKDFRFSVKLPQTLSHEHRLAGTGPLLDDFLPAVEGLGGKLQGFLLQLPPSLVLDARVASGFLRAFRHRTDAALACEPRHASWFTAKAMALFEKHQVSLVRADPPIVAAQSLPFDTPAWPYWRWHGSPRMYYSEYSTGRLQSLADAVTASKRSAVRPWVIFDNTAHGFAVTDALRLQDMVRKLPARKPRRAHA